MAPHDVDGSERGCHLHKMLITSRIIVSVSSFGPASGIPENSRFDRLVYSSFLSACSSSALTLSSSAVTLASLPFNCSMSCSIRVLWRSNNPDRGCGYSAVFNFPSTRSSFSSFIKLTLYNQAVVVASHVCLSAAFGLLFRAHCNRGSVSRVVGLCSCYASATLPWTCLTGLIPDILMATNLRCNNICIFTHMSPITCQHDIDQLPSGIGRTHIILICVSRSCVTMISVPEPRKTRSLNMTVST